MPFLRSHDERQRDPGIVPFADQRDIAGFSVCELDVGRTEVVAVSDEPHPVTKQGGTRETVTVEIAGEGMIGRQAERKAVLTWSAGERVSEVPDSVANDPGTVDVVAAPISDDRGVATIAEDKTDVRCALCVLIPQHPYTGAKDSNRVSPVAIPISHDGDVPRLPEVEDELG